MAQVIDKQITDFLPLLDKQEKQTLLNVIESFMNLKEQNRISIEQYNNEIDASEKEYEEGNFITQSAFKKEIRQW
ncbi:MAG: hypothetical protein IPL21_18510 [Saprospirales bacterium]|nr:hypothetical protein [Saprospirales bacterium]